MKTNKKWMIGVCLATTLLAGSWVLCGTAFAAPLLENSDVPQPLRMFSSGQFGRLLALRSELDLSTEQREQIRTILKSHRQEIATVIQPVVEKRRVLREATIAKDANEATIRAAAAELGKAIGDAAVLGSKIKTEVRAVLTPEQQQKVDEFRIHAESAVDQLLQNAADAS